MSDIVPSGLNAISIGNALINVENATQAEGTDPILINIQKTVNLIRANTDSLVGDQKKLINSLTGGFQALLDRLANTATSQSKEWETTRKQTRDYEYKREAFEKKTYTAYSEALNRIYGVGNKTVDALMKNFEETNRERAMSQKRFEDLTTTIKEQMTGSSKEAEKVQQADVRGKAIANNRMAAGNFITSLAERTSPMAAFLLQRFAGQSMEGRRKIQERKAADYSNIEMSKVLGGSSAVENYKMYRNDLEAKKRAQFGNRENIATAIRTGGIGVPSTALALAAPQSTAEGNSGGVSWKVMGENDAFASTGGEGSEGAVSKLPTPFAVTAKYLGNAIKGSSKDKEKKIERGTRGTETGGGGILGAAGGLLAKIGKIPAALAKVGAGILNSKVVSTIFGKNFAKLGSMTTKIGAAGAGKVASMAAKTAGRAALPVALITETILTAKKLVDINKDKTMSKQQKTVAKAGAVGSGLGGLGGSVGGAALGAAIGSVVPVLGTVVGAAIGGILGGIGGNKLGDLAGSAVGKALAKGPSPEVKPKMHNGGIVEAKNEMDVTLQKGEVVLPSSIGPLYQEIAKNTLASSRTLKTDILTKLIDIEDLLRDIKASGSSFPGATGQAIIGG